MQTFENIIKTLLAGKPANLGPYYTPKEMKAVLTDIRATVPSAWVMRSISTNNWIVYPK